MVERDWPAQTPDLNPIEHLWDELELRLRSRPNRPTSVPDLNNALVAEWKQVPGSNVPTSSGKPSQKSGGCYSSDIHYMTKSMWTPAHRTSHSKIMGINMELVPPLLL